MVRRCVSSKSKMWELMPLKSAACIGSKRSRRPRTPERPALYISTVSEPLDKIIRFGLHEYLMDFLQRIYVLAAEVSARFLVPTY